MMGTEPKFSTVNHPQTDGQTEKINHVLEEYLRHYVTAGQQNWVTLLDTVQFCYNLHKSSTTEMSSLKIVLGKQPMTPLDVAKSKNKGKCPATYKVARERHEILSEALDSLSKAQQRMKMYVDQHRRSVEFNVGEKVLVKLTPQICTEIVSKNRHRGLIRKYDGLFEVVK